MIVLYGIVTGILLLTGIFSVFYGREFWKEQKKKEKKVWWIDRTGLFLYEGIQRARRHFGRGRETEKKKQEQYKAVYIGEDDTACRRREQARTWGYMWLAGLGISIVGITVCLQAPDRNLPNGNRLPRPSFGQGETEYEITVSGLGEETEQITVTVGEQQPYEEQMNIVFAEALEEVKQKMLGENLSLEEVRTDLNFFTMTDQGIRLRWESGEETWLTSYGEIAGEDIPEEGILVPITLRMTYATYEAWYAFYVRILPLIKDIAYYKTELKQILQRIAESNPQEEYVELPGQLQEYQLEYAMAADRSGWYLGILGILAILMMGMMSGRKVEKQYEKRNAQMMEDYSQIISQLSILILCGMNIRNAWSRIAEQYEKRRAKGTTEFRYAYEEMRVTNSELERGFQESKSYGEFGKRCGIYSYVKLGNLLEQGFRQGACGMEEALQNEAADALERRIHEVKRRGERAETKMLIPMFLMLGIVMAVLMVPAFLSF